VREEPVGEGLGEDRAVVAVERGEARGELVEERPVAALVVADREPVAVGAQPAVHRAAGVLDASALPAVIGIEVVAALESDRRGQRERRVQDAGGVGVAQAGLPAVGAGQPAEQMVEAAILHHHDHDVLDAGELGQRQQIEQAGVAALAAQQQRPAGGRGRALEESSSRGSVLHGQRTLCVRVRRGHPAGRPFTPGSRVCAGTTAHGARTGTVAAPEAVDPADPASR
jgi:hypothetical protein